MITIKQKENKHMVEFRHLQMGDTFIIYNTTCPILCMKIRDVRLMYQAKGCNMYNTVMLGYVNDINDVNDTDHQTGKKAIDAMAETSCAKDNGRMLCLPDTYSCEEVDIEVEIKK